VNPLRNVFVTLLLSSSVSMALVAAPRQSDDCEKKIQEAKKEYEKWWALYKDAVKHADAETAKFNEAYQEYDEVYRETAGPFAIAEKGKTEAVEVSIEAWAEQHLAEQVAEQFAEGLGTASLVHICYDQIKLLTKQVSTVNKLSEISLRAKGFADDVLFSLRKAREAKELQRALEASCNDRRSPHGSRERDVRSDDRMSRTDEDPPGLVSARSVGRTNAALVSLALLSPQFTLASSLQSAVGSTSDSPAGSPAGLSSGPSQGDEEAARAAVNSWEGAFQRCQSAAKAYTDAIGAFHDALFVLESLPPSQSETLAGPHLAEVRKPLAVALQGMGSGVRDIKQARSAVAKAKPAH
jgi:hypothetical protein